MSDRSIDVHATVVDDVRVSYPPPQQPVPPPQQYHVQVQQPVTDKSKRFLNLSAGALISIIAGILLVCCVGPIALCVLSPALTSFMDVSKTKPDVELTSCRIEGGTLPTATVGMRVTNKGSSTQSYLVKLEIRDSSGARVGDGTELVSRLAPGDSATEEATIYLDGPASSGSCHVVDVT